VAINGLLRLNEIVSFEWSNISLGSIDEGSESTPMIQMSVLRSKRTGPKAMKKFLISDALSTEILTRYMNSFDIKTGRFFRKLNENLKPTMSPIGQKTISIYPQKIAEFLHLPEADKYTSHSFRHTGASVLADDGATVMQLQQAGGWESSSIAQSYVEEGVHSRMQIAQRFEDSTSASSVTKKSRTTIGSSSKMNDIHISSLMPSISIGAGSSNNHIHVNIGYPQASVDAATSISTADESKSSD